MKLKNPKKTAWDLMSKIVRLSNADWKRQIECFTCGVKGSWKEFDAGHYIHRNSLDFDKVNIQVQCSKCNRYLHGNSGRFAYQIVRFYGQKELERLEKLRFKEHRFTTKELYKIINKLKKELESYEKTM